MKKIFSILAVALGVTSIAACSGNSKTADNTGDDLKELKDEVYTGVIPAADCDGIRYSLTLAYDTAANDKEGDYSLLETYLQSDTTSTTGYKDLKSFKSKGDFAVIKGEGVNLGKTYLKLTQDSKDSEAGSAAGPIYFVVDSDSTITMVNSDFEVSQTPGMNYTLTQAK
jgi:hypothetical protein